MKLYAILALGALLAAGSASAATTINVPAEQSTIQAAIDAANDGDTVLVAPGTYFEKLNFNGKAITVKSSGGAAVTTLDGSNGGSIVTFGSSEGNSSVLQGFTLTHAFAATYGGAVFIAGASPTIEDNIFVDNQECGFWGAAIGGNASSPVILRNYFSGNGCTEAGIIYVDNVDYDSVVGFENSSSPVIADNVFVNNPSAAYVQFLSSGASPSVYNNTLVGNFDAVLVDVSAINPGAFFSNNLIAFNHHGLNATFSNGATLPTWSHNLVYDNTTANYAGVSDQTGTNGNISAAPFLKDWGNGDVHLLSASPAIEAGDNGVSQMSGTDVYGNTRVFDGDSDGTAAVDIGAAESIVPDAGQPASTIINVPADQLTIQAGIDVAHNTYTVLVAPGTYYEQLDFGGKPITVKSSGGAVSTILDGNNTGPIVIFHNGEGNTSVLQGFTLMHAAGSFGGAVVMASASPTIEDNVFVDNADADLGTASAILGVFSSGLIIRNYFADNVGLNTDTSFDIVVSLSGGSPVVADNVFVNNTALACYVRMLPAGGTPQVYNNTMVGNTTAMEVIVDNWSPGTTFSNNVLAFNQGVGLGMFIDVGAVQPPFSNNLVYGNAHGDYAGITSQSGMNGNISADPRLEDWSNGDVHLLYGSPAIDTGNSTVNQASTTDFYGNTRLFAGNPGDSMMVDMGAVEYQPPVVTAVDGSLSVSPNTATNGTLGFSGADSTEPLTFVLVSLPTHGTVILNAANGVFQYVPAQGYIGPDSFTFHITDPYSTVSNTAAEQLTVVDIAPTANAGSLSTTADTAVMAALSATRAYPTQPLTFSMVSTPAHGTVSLTATNGQFKYTPTTGFTGSDSFTFQVADTYGAVSGVATESVTVNDLAPKAYSALIKVMPNRLYSGILKADKAYSGQVLTYSVVGRPLHGTLTLTNPGTGAFTYTAARGFTGKDSFTFKVTDQWGAASNTVTVTIAVL